MEEYLKEAAFPQQQEPGEGMTITGNTVWGARESVTAMCGALLFLGIILGLVCLFATVLIVYYKQISEGYEDRARFQIMQKVGMSRREVKSTINSQVLLVFFLPLVVAGDTFGLCIFPFWRRCCTFCFCPARACLWPARLSHSGYLRRCIR